MPDTKREREQLEVIYITILLMYRPYLFFGAVLLIGFTLFIVISAPAIGYISAGLTIFLLLLASSYRAALLLARLGAWIATRRLPGND